MSSSLVLCACPPIDGECLTGEEPSCEDAGSLPPDFCNSQEEAEADTRNCHLTVTQGGAEVQRKGEVYLSRLTDGGVDQDWYFAQLPGGLTARSLLHVNGGYQVPQTAVNFSLNVLKQGADGKLTTVVNGIDRHGAAAPKPVDLIIPFGEANAKLWVLVQDEGGGNQNKVDNRNPYSLFVEVQDNPDSNEPNDTTPTSIALNAGTGSATGYLATNNDVDLFTFTVAAGARQIIYLHLTETGTHPTNPPPGYRLAYVLTDPAGVPVAEGQMDNEFLQIDLATAKLVGMSGAYQLKVSGYRAANSNAVIKGDLRVQYKVDVQILPDLDTLEPNDTLMTARSVSMSPNSKQTLVGKLAHVPDDEWFRVSLPARSTPSTLRYEVKAAMSGGRFAPLSGTPARQVRVMRPVAGASAPERTNACLNDAVACPRASDYDETLHRAICNLADPALCLYSQRNEENPRLANLRNLVGAIPVPANQATEWLIAFRDEGQGASKYADDRDWTMTLEWADDADEAGRGAGATQVTLGGSTVISSGELTFGYGRYLDENWFMRGQALRSAADYDAIDTDTDLYEFSYGGATGDQAWEISWDLAHPDGGTQPPGELAFEMTFCGGAGASPLCTGGERRIFAFNEGSLTPWYLPQSFSNGRVLFTRQGMGAFTRYTAEPVGCWCHSATRVATGHFFADVAAVHRTSNEPIKYSVRQRLSAYPGSYPADGGSTVSCPVVDGGCGFAR